MTPFRILLVDDEETFLYSTADLLRREGFECDCVPEVALATDLLAENAYSLVIADINMPGNSGLEFVQDLARSFDGMSIILVTAYPSVASAIQSVELPVVAYLIKPFGFQDLLAKVRSACQFARVQELVRDELARQLEYRRGLLRVAATMRLAPRGAQMQSLQAFAGITLRNIVDGLAGLHHLLDETGDPGSGDGEMPFASSIPGDLRAVLCETVATLERTKTAFKSKELGELRRRLEALLKN
jgi:CheY-like chemotaxis protein